MLTPDGRVGPYRVIFAYVGRRTIECVYAERRGIVYEIFAEEMIERLVRPVPATRGAGTRAPRR